MAGCKSHIPTQLMTVMVHDVEVGRLGMRQGPLKGCSRSVIDGNVAGLIEATNSMEVSHMIDAEPRCQVVLGVAGQAPSLP